MNDKMIRVLDYTLFSVLGLFAFLYAEGWRRFAELHVQFKFLSFPVFIGEFLLLFCLILFFIKIYLQKVKFNAWHGLIVIYFVFVVGKALIGYHHRGPLAFRDAALFYYFAFAVIGYYCYRPDYFNRFVILSLYAILVSSFIFHKYPLYYLFTMFIFGLVLAYRYPDRRVGVCMAASMIGVTPYNYFVDTARMMVLGNFVASVFIAAAGCAFLKQRDAFKYPVMAGLIILLGLGFFYFSNDKKAQSILKIKEYIEIFQEIDRDIQAQKPTFKLQDRSRSELYHPEPEKVTEERKSIVENTSDIFFQKPTVWKVKSVRTETNNLNNGVFRLFIWRDMWDDWNQTKPVFGVDFGKPFRSVSLEIRGWAEVEWARDGWVAAHNSFWNMLYRSGLFGVVFIAMFWSVFVWMTAQFIRHRSVVGIFLSAVLLNWFVAAHFLLIFELPYTAIPIWTLYGVTLAYAHRLPGNNLKDAK